MLWASLGAADSFHSAFLLRVINDAAAGTAITDTAFIMMLSFLYSYVVEIKSMHASPKHLVTHPEYCPRDSRKIEWMTKGSWILL